MNLDENLDENVHSSEYTLSIKKKVQKKIFPKKLEHRERHLQQKRKRNKNENFDSPTNFDTYYENESTPSENSFQLGEEESIYSKSIVSNDIDNPYSSGCNDCLNNNCQDKILQLKIDLQPNNIKYFFASNQNYNEFI